MTNKIDIETALRASLAEHARHAPAADVLAERIIAGAQRQPPERERRRSRQWRTWTLPLIAAGSVAAVAAALVGVTQFHRSAELKPPAVSHTSVVPAPTPTTAPAPTSPAPKPSKTTTRAAVTDVGLTHFLVMDVTFVGADRGWALGTADCLDASGGPCAAMVRTTDGGATWHSMKPPPANVALLDCTDPCIRSVRFATDQIGYAYGSSALFMTTDGGTTWQRQRGGAAALETLDGNVIRVVTSVAGCSPPGCHYNVSTAPIGSAHWQGVDLVGDQGSGVGAALVRTGSRAFIEVFGHVAGGGQDATSILYASDDDGATWARRGEPCPQSGGEVDSKAITTAPDGSVTVLCTRRAALGTQFTSTSSDGGASFRPGGRDALGAAPITALGAASAAVLFVSSDATYRSPDGGSTWLRLRANGGSGPGPATFIGFESATVGRAIADSGRTIWTTRDAGLTWTPYTFH